MSFVLFVHSLETLYLLQDIRLPQWINNKKNYYKRQPVHRCFVRNGIFVNRVSVCFWDLCFPHIARLLFTHQFILYTSLSMISIWKRCLKSIINNWINKNAILISFFLFSSNFIIHYNYTFWFQFVWWRGFHSCNSEIYFFFMHIIYLLIFLYSFHFSLSNCLIGIYVMDI